MCACFRRPSWHEREGPELTMAINANSEQCPNQARRPREADHPLWGAKGEWPGGRRAAHTARECWEQDRADAGGKRHGMPDAELPDHVGVDELRVERSDCGEQVARRPGGETIA